MNRKKRIEELVTILCKASTAYYRDDNPIMSDKAYDDLYDELEMLEKETGMIFMASPTQKVQGEVVESLKKVEHKTPMLSANKTKNLSDIIRFINDKKVVQSWKLDGLTVVAEYKTGILHRAITRGNGMIGEDVTHTFRYCINLPAKLKEPVDITFRGECVVPWDTFKEINATLSESYSHPRNLAAGSLRQLDSMIARERRLEYYVFDIVEGYDSGDLGKDFAYAKELGMPVVDYCTVTDLEACCNTFNPNSYRLPVDGLIYKYQDTLYGKALGSTSHHPLDMIALKWEDELFETTLTDIEWQTSRSGLINPVAVFSPIDLGGAITSKATLHNISYIEDLQLGIGDTIQVYRANMVIPKVHNNLTRSNTWSLPTVCPACGGNVAIHNENGSKTLHCCNDVCKAKLLGKLIHAVSRNALNIVGLSEATLENFIDLGWITSLLDIYHLKNHIDEITSLNGFGKKSAKKLLDSIENSRNTTLDRFVYALSIPLIGRSASKDIAMACNYSFGLFVMIMSLEAENAFIGIDGFGKEMNKSLMLWWSDNKNKVDNLVKEFNFIVPESNKNSVDLSGKTFVITGPLLHFNNRDEAKARIESLGGKVSGSVSAKTAYLVNNDSNSTSSKNQKAKSLGIPIINETELLNILGENQED